MLFIKFLVLRTLLALLSWGYFVPDEVWQSVEVAHQLVFGNGYLTWEWDKGIRSYLHPGFFAIFMYLVKILGLDHPMIIVIGPKILQGLVSAVGDVCMVRVFKSQFSEEKANWFAMIYATNWFILYASSRTLVNTFETALTNMALFLYCKQNSAYVAIISLSFMVRPTTAIFWLPMVSFDISRMKLSRLAFKLIPQALLVVAMCTFIDSVCYGKLTLVPWNFLQINLINNISEQYGVHPWHWYLTNFMPALTLGFGLYPLAVGIYKKASSKDDDKQSKALLVSLIWSLLIYSLLGHKEHRFIMPLIPMILAYLTCGLKKAEQLWLFMGLNVILAAYLSLFHQSAPHWTMQYLSSLKNSRGILFLTPCHGTPYYSHLHWNVPMRFLECPPDLGDNPRDNSALFLQDPVKFLSVDIALGEYDHVVFFDKLEPIIGSHLSGLTLCKKFWHTHFPEENTSQNILIYCRNK